MKVSQGAKETPYRRNSYRENSKPSYYNAREEQKPAYNYVQQTKIRIVQDNLVSVSGLPSEYDNPDLLGDNQHFGKYGTVDKIIISSQGKHRTASIQVYITYEKMADAAFAIKALDGIKIKGREITATFGTTKYCTYFLKQNQCRNQKCFYLHGYDTKNELMDGVKNNMDFLDQKSQRIINENIRYYLQKQLIQKQQKDISQFPTIGQTVQYLMEQEMLQKGMVERLRKEIVEERKMVKRVGKEEGEGERGNNNSSNRQQNEERMGIDKMIKESGVGGINKSKTEEIRNKSQSARYQKQQQQQQQQQKGQNLNLLVPLQDIKNKKCHSLSTTSSPTKYQKLGGGSSSSCRIQQQQTSQSIDKTIQRRIIKQIMRSNIIYRSKMDFVVGGGGGVGIGVNMKDMKEENNRIKNYVRKYLLNEM